MMASAPLQTDSAHRLRHFLSVEGLTPAVLLRILDTATQFLADPKDTQLLAGVTVANLFFEASTRTRTTFELAAKRLGAEVINLNIDASSTSKGESLLDTLRNLEAMRCDIFVVRHSDSGAAHFIARHVAPEVAVINAGDGWHAHPTQALLDMLTIRRHKPAFPNISVALVGDILHSRVARSNIAALNSLGVRDIRVIAPKTLLPADVSAMNVRVYHDLQAGIQAADVIIMLRLQRERMQSGLLPNENEYFSLYGLTPALLAAAKPDVIVMHPGPINRGVELDSAVADGTHSVILQQVTHGIAVRMAVMALVMQSRGRIELGVKS